MTSMDTFRNTSKGTLRDVLTRLEKEGAALSHFNVSDQVLLKAVVAAAAELDQLTDSLKQRPWSLVRIKQPKEREVPQQK